MSCMTADYTDPPPGDDLDRSVDGMLRARRVVIGVLATVFLALPAVSVFRHQGLSGDAAFLVPGTVVFIVLVDRWVMVRGPVPPHRPLRDEVVLWVIVVLGVALAMSATKLIASFIYDVQRNDPTTLAGSALLLAIVGALAAAIPAWRAARLDPVATLRED